MAPCVFTEPFGYVLKLSAAVRITVTVDRGTALGGGIPFNFCACGCGARVAVCAYCQVETVRGAVFLCGSGLIYRTHTAFEIQADECGNQSRNADDDGKFGERAHAVVRIGVRIKRCTVCRHL